jgi:ABC-2 type transport system ATP-binding protein
MNSNSNSDSNGNSNGNSNSNSSGNSNGPPAIEVVGVHHRFKKHHALQGVTFTVQPKSLHGFVGPNGAGKTTSLKLICTLLQPQTGTVRVFGHDVVRDVKKVRQRIGFMPDHFSMYRQMTVFEYLDFFAAAYGLSLSQRDRVIGDVLALTDMDGRRNDLINGLSRGMQQRVGLARVLVNDPDLLLLDEPASGLDPRARIELMEILKALQAMGKTIFISSHILSELAELCDSVTIIDRGQVKQSCSMDELLSHGQEQPVYRIKLNSPPDNAVELLKSLPGVVSSEASTHSNEFRVSYDPLQTDTIRLLRSILDAGLVITGFTEERKHLNEVFMSLTERGVRT